MQIEWLTGQYEGYGLIERDGGYDVVRQSGVSIGFAGDFDCAVTLMEGDE